MHYEPLCPSIQKIITPAQLSCPRCLGKGHVEVDDIIRLKQEGNWSTGTCAYCNGSGKIDESMLSKVPVDASWLTNDLSESERNAILNNNNKEVSQSIDKYDDCPVSEYSRLWLEDAFLLLLDFFLKRKDATKKSADTTLFRLPCAIRWNRTIGI